MKTKRTHPGGVVRRAICLPKSIDEEVEALVATDAKSYSGVVREALAVYVGMRRLREAERSYADYYGDAAALKRDLRLAEDLARLSGAEWPPR